MRKKIKGRKFSRKRGQRRALLRSLANEFFLKEKIKTTESKAKEIKKVVEKFISKGKKGDLASRRHLLRFLPKRTVKKLVAEIAPRFKSRPGGYTRIVRLGPRESDGAKMAIIELVK